MRDIRKTVGQNIRHLRDIKDVSQEAFALEIELHRTYLSGVERGKRNPTVLIIEKIAKGLGVKPHILLDPETAKLKNK